MPPDVPRRGGSFMAKIKINVNEHIVCGEVEIDHFLCRGVIKIKKFNTRQDLFLKIKNPTTQYYQGSWGPEILTLEDRNDYLGRVGRIHCTYERYREIAQWFLDNLQK